MAGAVSQSAAGARAPAKRCVRAGARAAQAQAAAQAEREAQGRSRALDLLNGALVELAKLAAERGDAAPTYADRVAARLAEAIACQIEAVLMDHPSSSSA